MAGKIVMSFPGGGGGEPGGNDKEIQFNDSGVFAGGAQLFWDKANNRLGLGDSTPAQQFALTKCMELLECSGSGIGVIYKGTDRFIHDYKATGANGDNTFIGSRAGNFTMAISGQAYHASKNTGFGTDTLAALTYGYNNAAFGNECLAVNTSGSSNMALGSDVLKLNTTGNQNAGVGASCLRRNVDGDGNTIVGYQALYFNTTGDDNVCIGNQAGCGVDGHSIHNNVCIGYRTGYLLRGGGDNNILIGYQAGDNVSSGEKNIIIGYNLNALSATADYQLNIASTIFGALGATKKIGINTSTMNETLNVGGAIRLGTSALTNTGAIRWSGTDFEGYNGGWKSLTILKGLNEIFTTRGDIVFRGVADPVRLAAGTANYVLTAHGAGTDPTWAAAQGGATKEFFVPATATSDGGSVTNKERYAGVKLLGLNQKAYITFRVPHDYSSIANAEVIVIPNGTHGSANWDLYSHCAQVGQSCTSYAQQNTVSTYNVTNAQIFAVNVASILTHLTAGSLAGLMFKLSNATHAVTVLGIRFRYSA